MLYTPIEKDKTVFIPDFPDETTTLKEVADTLKKIESLTDSELIKIIQNDYRLFLDERYLLNYEYRQVIIDVFSNKRFLRALTNVLSTVVLSETQVICCNKVTWDYMSQNNNKDKEVADILLNLSSIINRQVSNLLMAYVPEKIAQMIALARYSSFKEEKNVTRVNRIIVKFAKGISIQQIVNIYSVIFRNTRISIVFSAIMLDADTSNLSEEESERYSSIGVAILEILEQGMSSKDIATILRVYASQFDTIDGSKPYRFSMYSNSQTDYPRIYAVLDQLSAHGINIP